MCLILDAHLTVPTGFATSLHEMIGASYSATTLSLILPLLVSIFRLITYEPGKFNRVCALRSRLPSCRNTFHWHQSRMLAAIAETYDDYQSSVHQAAAAVVHSRMYYLLPSPFLEKGK